MGEGGGGGLDPLVHVETGGPAAKRGEDKCEPGGPEWSAPKSRIERRNRDQRNSTIDQSKKV